MLAKLRLGVETAPRVIEVHMPTVVQSTELRAAELIEAPVAGSPGSARSGV